MRFSGVGVKLMKAQTFAGGDVSGILETARLADRMGVDEVHVSDHVLMSASGHAARETFPYTLDYDGWYEPFSLLSAIAAVTKEVTLASHVVVAPLRPAVVLAKQIATLDALSNGRVHLGLGTGWQREEFSAAGIPFAGRLTRMVEQVEASRELWSGAPASYHGQTVSFDEVYSLPTPPQGAELRISFGIPAGPRGLSEIARLGVGYCPSFHLGGDLSESITAARAAYAEAGRDPASLVVTSELPMEPERDSRGRPDWGASFAVAHTLREAGVDVLLTHVVPHCETLEQVEEFIGQLLELRD